MANVQGTAGDDVIHLAGDGLWPDEPGLINLALATNEADSLLGLDGNDILRGAGGCDSLYGGSGNDLLVVRRASDLVAGERYAGGDGEDVLFGSGIGLPLQFETVTLASVEQIIGFGAGASFLAAQVSGLQVLDTGALTVVDGGEIDLNSALVLTRQFHLSDFGNTFRLYIDGEPDLGFDGFRGRVIGGAGSDTILLHRNTSESHSLPILARGMTGDDLIGVGGDNATVFGGSGDDTVSFGGLLTAFHGGAGSDSVQCSFLAEGAEVAGGRGYDELAINALSPADLTLADVNGFESLGGASGPVRIGLDQMPQFRLIQLVDGTTSIVGSGVVDLSHTALSDSHMFLDSGDDVVTLRAMRLTDRLTLDCGAGDDLVTVLDNPGLPLRVWLIANGGAGNDTLFGGDAKEHLGGGAGNDQLTGNGGKDVFVFDSRIDNGIDTISDFSGLRSGNIRDQIAFHLAAGPPRYLGEAVFTGHGFNEVRFDGSGLSVDLDGDGSADLQVILQGMTAASDLSSSDFAWEG